jgi:hypothetical protein
MSALCHKQTHAPQQKDLYSITSSARASTGGGTSRPSAFAVLRLNICFTHESEHRDGPQGIQWFNARRAAINTAKIIMIVDLIELQLAPSLLDQPGA